MHGVDLLHWFGDGSQHGGGQLREDVVDLLKEKGKEAGIARTYVGEESEELRKVIARSEREGVGGWWEEGEKGCQGTGRLEEFLDLQILVVEL